MIFLALALASSGCATARFVPVDGAGTDGGTDAPDGGDGGMPGDSAIDGGAPGPAIDPPAPPIAPSGAPTIIGGWLPSTDAAAIGAATLAARPSAPSFASCAPWGGGGATPCEPWPAGRATCTGPSEHFPGEPGCHVVGGTCPASGWGSGVPTSGTIIYVDRSAPSGGSGTMSSPYASLANALTDAAGRTGPVFIALTAGNYVGELILPASVTVIGACAGTVLTNTAGVAVRAGAMTGLRNLTVRSADRGIVVPAGASLTLDDVLVEDTRVGVHVEGGRLDATDLVVRTSRAGADARGVLVTASGQASITRAFVHDIAWVGIDADGGSATLQEVAVRSVPSVGVRVASTGSIVANGVVVEQADSGISSTGSTIEVDRVVLRSLTGEGFGSLSSTITLRRILVSTARAWGLSLNGMATVTDAIIRDISRHPSAPDLYGLHGMGIRTWGTNLTIDRMLIQDVDATGIAIWEGSAATIRSLELINPGRFHQHDQNGSGVSVTDAARLTLESSRIGGARGAGVLVGGCLEATCGAMPDVMRAGVGTTAAIHDVVVEDVVPALVGPLTGHGVLVTGSATADLARVEIERTGGAKIAVGDAAIGYAGLAMLEPSVVTVADVLLRGGGRGIWVTDGASLGGAGAAIASGNASAIRSEGAIALDDVVVADMISTEGAIATANGGTIESARVHVVRTTNVIDAASGSLSMADVEIVGSGPATARGAAALSLARTRVSSSTGDVVVATGAGTTLTLMDLLVQAPAALPTGGMLVVRGGASATVNAAQLAGSGGSLVVVAERDTAVDATDVALECTAGDGACTGVAVIGSGSASIARLAIAGARGLGAGSFGGTLDLTHARITDTTPAPCGDATCAAGIGAYDTGRVAAGTFQIVRSSSVGAQLGTDTASMTLTTGAIRDASIGVAMLPDTPVALTDVTIACRVETSTDPAPRPSAPTLP